MSAKITGTEFEFIGANLPFWPDPAVAIASARAGATGLLNLEGIDDLDLVRQALQRLVSFNLTGLAVKLNPRYSISVQVSEELPEAVNTVVLAISLPEQGEAILERLRKDGRRVLVEVTEETEELWRSANCVPDGFVAKGHEAPGRVGEETTFILLQRLRAVTEIPVFAYGGIGLHSVAACYAAGAAGVILDSQFALAGESNLPVTVREAITYMEGDETVCLGNEIGGRFRVLNRPSNSALRDLEELEQKLIGEQGDLIPEQWFLECEARVDWKGTDESLWPLGQDAAFAASLGRRYQSVSGIIRAFRRSLHEHIQAAVAKPLLQRGSSLAQAHGTEYPIVQGPMTRVSDVPEFADAVARSGALPFLALALLRADRVRSLLKKTQQLLGERPWGVGILGFVPPELRQEQLGVIREIRPRFAIIAGGRPDQAARLEDLGIRTYLHVPSPILLRSFLEGGARRFIFEGRECGGHVGPRSSFVLWNTAIDVLSDAIDSGAAKAEELNVLFAGGIHDARSAAMVSAMAAPLARSGVNVGILMGTAYLFTREAVESGAIVEGFQETALSCSR
ncbi:MAG TPA: nitronate monooxygenase, partial [Acidobacteriota bacterium]|nr:nitronate monooxygenase [Acidobacteriota bacterium]